MRKHWFVIIVALLLTATVCAAGCTSNNTSSPPASPTRSPTFVPKTISGYRTYTNSSAGLAIQYPPSWQLAEPGGIYTNAFFSVTGVNMSFTIAAPESFSGQSVTLDQFSQDFQSALQQNATSFTANSSNISLAGYPAQKLVFTLVTGGVTRQGVSELTIVNNTGYALTYVANQDVYSDYAGIAQNMMQSFNITS